MEHYKRLKDEELTELIHTYTIDCKKLLHNLLLEKGFNTAKEFLKAKKFLNTILVEKMHRQFLHSTTVGTLTVRN